MSSRVRFAGTHPNYGSVTGGKIVYYIKYSWDARFPRGSGERVYPFGYKKWPHWKRTLWMAKMEGTWKVQVYREPRGTDSRKSLYGKKMKELGIAIKRPNKKKIQDVVRKANRLYVAGGVDPIDGVMPPPPMQVRFQNDWNPWGGHQAQQVAGNQAQVAPIPMIIRNGLLNDQF